MRKMVGNGDSEGKQERAALTEEEIVERARKAPSLVLPYSADAAGVEADTLTVTLGAQKFAPVQYHSFDVGPYALTGKLLPGETHAEAHLRLMAQLRAMALADYEHALQTHLERVKRAAVAARSSR